MVLGRAEFLDEVRARMRDPGELDRLLAAPVRDRASDGVPSFETVVTGVARAYGTSMEQLLQATSRPSEARQVAMYGAHRMARLTVRAIGARFGVGYSAVSRTVRAVMRRLEMDAGLRARVDASLGHSET
jgi:chromosomal replication initiation ATPase DnaA